ncbi:MAG TPA: hypothetical protein VNG33_14760, partial [Polyangiaceae bacterium]|nr:hypothetical protein [Polyangiaceae bacterium]
MADSVLAGDLAAGSEVYPRGPLYAYWLVPFRWLGDGLTPIYLAQIGLSALTLWLLYDLVKARWSALAACAATCGFALYGAAAMHELKVMATTMSILLVVASVWSLFRLRPRFRYPLGGAAFGLSVACSPSVLITGAVAGVWVLTAGTWRFRPATLHRRLRAALQFGAGLTLVLAPIVVRNWRVAGEPGLTSAAGVTFYQGNNPRAEGTYSELPGFSGDPIKQPLEAQRQANDAAGRVLSSAEANHYWVRQGVDYWLSSPTDAASLMARKLRYWLGSDELSMEYVLGTERELNPALWSTPLPFAPLVALALVGLGRRSMFGKQGLLLALI